MIQAIAAALAGGLEWLGARLGMSAAAEEVAGVRAAGGISRAAVRTGRLPSFRGVPRGTGPRLHVGPKGEFIPTPKTPVRPTTPAPYRNPSPTRIPSPSYPTPAPQPRIPVPGTKEPPDFGRAQVHRKVQAGLGSVPVPTPNPAEAGVQGRSWLDTANSLAFQAQSTAQLVKDNLPKLYWNIAVGARGFKKTPLNTVVHYCLAVAFGCIKQTRIGSTAISVKTFPIENRVEIAFSHAAALLLEQFNMGFAGKALVGEKNVDELTDIVTKGARRVTESDNIFDAIGNALGGTDAIRTWVTNKIVNPKAAKDEATQGLGSVSRAVGPGAIWDMGQSDIYAGTPTAILGLGRGKPFDDMLAWRTQFNRPMLTRNPAMNPEPPHSPDWAMHETHLDLRSLVAQALYDPGVLPPPPNTVVALKEATL